MFSAHFLLVIIIAFAVKASPITVDYPDQQPDPINPDIDYYTTQNPDTASGLGIFVLLQISVNKDIGKIYDCEHNDIDLNLAVEIFAGIEETSQDIMEVVARKALSILNRDESYNDGLLEGLLQGRGSKLNLNIDESYNAGQLKGLLRKLFKCHEHDES